MANFLTKIKIFFRQMFIKDEEIIDNFSAAIVGATNKKLTIDQKIEILKRAVEYNYPFADMYIRDIMNVYKTRISYSFDIYTNNRKLNILHSYMIGMGDTILRKLGYDTVPGKLIVHRDQTRQEQIEKSCTLQRMRIDFERINHISLNSALSNNYELKQLWKSGLDPRMVWSTKINELEETAYQNTLKKDN